MRTAAKKTVTRAPRRRCATPFDVNLATDSNARETTNPQQFSTATTDDQLVASAVRFLSTALCFCPSSDILVSPAQPCLCAPDGSARSLRVLSRVPRLREY